MGILDVASAKSVWRGYYCFEEKRVLWCEKTSETTFVGAVEGSAKEPYQVTVDIAHPKRSECDCPHAEGTRRVCKHKVALYFAAFPEEAKRLLEEAEEYAKQEEQRQEEMQERVIKYVHKLKKSELEELFLEMLFYGPDWQYRNFIRDYME